MNIDSTVHFDYPLLFGFDFFSWILFSKKYFIFFERKKRGFCPAIAHWHAFLLSVASVPAVQS